MELTLPEYPFISEKGTVLINNKPVLIISFSGGQTSAYMSYMMKKKYGDKYHIIFIFSNTGCENNETLDFVDQCDKAFNLNVVWVEAVVNPEHRKGITHRITSYKDAFRADQYKHPKHPFHAHIKKSGIPNANKPQCSDRLKAFVIEDYKRSLKIQGQPHLIGIRHDESNRILSASHKKLVESCGAKPDEWRLLGSHDERIKILENAIMLTDKQKNSIINYSSKLRSFGLKYPLADLMPTTKDDINDFWEEQDFRLMIEDHEGNCMVCWKKSAPKLLLLASESPERFEAFDWFEKTYDTVKPNDNGVRRVFFRKNKCSQDILDESKEFTSEYLRRQVGALLVDSEGDGCSESCESYNIN